MLVPFPLCKQIQLLRRHLLDQMSNYRSHTGILNRKGSEVNGLRSIIKGKTMFESVDTKYERLELIFWLFDPDLLQETSAIVMSRMKLKKAVLLCDSFMSLLPLLFRCSISEAF